MYAGGEVPVSFHHSTWRVPVRNLATAIALPGEIVHYIDDLTADAGHGTNCAVKPSDTKFNGNAIVGLLLEPVEAEATAEVYVLLQFARRDWHWLSCPAAERLPNTAQRRVVFRGTRVPLSMLFEHLQEGGNIVDFIDDYDAVSMKQVTQVLPAHSTGSRQIRGSKPEHNVPNLRGSTKNMRVMLDHCTPATMRRHLPEHEVSPRPRWDGRPTKTGSSSQSQRRQALTPSSHQTRTSPTKSACETGRSPSSS